MKIRYKFLIGERYVINKEQAYSSAVTEIIKFNRSKFEEANVLFTPMFVTHERLSLEPYQTWQYCEVADIEPFQGQSDQIFQFSIIQNRVRIPFFARTERSPGEDYDSFSSPLTRSANGERERENPSVSSRSADRGSMKAERARAREHKIGVQTKTQKRESLDPTFRAMPAILVPSDHRCGST